MKSNAFVWLLLSAQVVCAQQPPPEQQAITVTGSADAIPLEEADRSVRVLRITPALRLLTNTWADLLRMDPSLDLRERAPNGVQGDLSVRGGTFGQTLVLLDGMRLSDSQSAHHNLDLPVPLESLQQMEILKGAGSTLYGSDAVGGVVQLRTRLVESPELTLRTAFGSFGTNQQRALLAGGKGRWNGQLSMSRDFSTGFERNRDYRNLSFAGLGHVRTRLGTTSVLLAQNDRPFGAENFYGLYPSWERTRTWFASVRQTFGEQTEADFAYRRHTDLFVLYRDQPQLFTNRHAVESWQTSVRRWEKLPAKARLHYGVEMYADSITSTNLGNHSRVRSSGYVSYDLRAWQRFSFSAGVREELYGALNSQLSPTASAAAWLNSHWKLRGSVSRAFRLPTFTDLFYHDPANIGSPFLRPERAWSYEGGVDSYWGRRLRAQVTVFQRRDRDGIDYVRASVTDVWRATNFQRLRFTGVEAGVEGMVARQQWDVRYSGLQGDRDAPGGLQSKYVFNYPVHSGVVTWQGDLRKGIAGRMRVGVVERYNRPAYGVWDASIAAVRGRWRPFLQATNLTSAVYQEIPGVNTPPRALLGGIEMKLF